MAFHNYNLVVILGPTASGKTEVAAHLAFKMNGEVISADSRQIYTGLDLGTGKDYKDYQINDFSVPYHLIDIRPAGYQYNVYEYQQDFLTCFQNILKESKLPILCGGSGLYIEAAIRGFRLIQVPVNEGLRKNLENKSLEELTIILSGYKELHNVSETDTLKRAIRAVEIAEYYKHHVPENSDYPDIRPLIIGVRFDRNTERNRITARLKQRLDDGMVEEVESLLNSGITPEQLLYYGLEYKFITLYLTGNLSYDEMFKLLNTAIHQFAKRQMTWFRRMERNGFQIHWIDGNSPLTMKIAKIMSLWNDPANSN
jgi:tRNA dimethylallyltransferase